jgi:phosphinothricin acetyltransferase
VPTVAEMQRRFDTIRQNNLPYLIAKIDGEIVGYAYANYFRERSAYRFTLEDSIYVSHQHIGLGIGEQLLSALIVECRLSGAIQLLAVIGDSDNQGSIKLHRKLGFEEVGVMQNVGYKFERFVDVVIMQLNLVPSGE